MPRNDDSTWTRGPGRLESAGTEAGSLAAGLVVTLGLFYGIAHFKGHHVEPPPPIEDLRAVMLPPEPPPKLPTTPTPVETAVPFAGLEVAASDSAVKITVLPPDLAALVPRTRVPPPAVIQTAQLITSFKPKQQTDLDMDHVFQPNEVDQRTTVLSRPTPDWPPGMKSDVHYLRVVFLMVVNTHGAAENVRLLKSSGYASFDDEVMAQIREGWVFSPAIKNGRKVRCLVQQAVLVKQRTTSPFEL